MAKATVLLVDGEQKMIELNRSALRWHGYDVMEAGSLAKAEAQLREKLPELIVLNTGLPDGSGVDWCCTLKERYGLPVILLSSVGGDLDIMTGLNAGADDYIVKPYDMSVFIARVELSIRKCSAYIKVGSK